MSTGGPGPSLSRAPMIRLERVRREFGPLTAVDDVSFQVQAGQVTGFVGANGAGKTTTMRMMVTLDLPTRGSIEIGGYEVSTAPAKVRELIGYAPDSFGTYPHVTVFEYLDFMARAHGFRGRARDQRVTEVLSLTGLESLAERDMDKLSKGTLQRLCLGRALIHDPEVLVLDEPAAGLDPAARMELKALIRRLAGKGKTVLISSHILTELAELCDHFLFIDRGRIIHSGPPESLRAQAGLRVLVQVVRDAEGLAAWSAQDPAVRSATASRVGIELELTSGDGDQLAALLARMIAAGFLVTDFHQADGPSLEAVFVETVERRRRDRP
ncbi:MAG: ABC transporter ATP-binding protein [Deltaproteobacteria bacterium]|nr:ABC transporter ATP-binding protein [Deltaproteobacteria bacterium]